MLQIMYYASLCLLLISGTKYNEDHNVIIVDPLPKVECINKILDDEIKYYLSQQRETKYERYWNLIIGLEYDMYDVPVLYKCDIHNTPNYIPDKGIAYMQYGHDIIVIIDSINELIFKEVDNCEKIIKMMTNRVPMHTSVAHLGLLFSENKVFQMNAEYY